MLLEAQFEKDFLPYVPISAVPYLLRIGHHLVRLYTSGRFSISFASPRKWRNEIEKTRVSIAERVDVRGFAILYALRSNRSRFRSFSAARSNLLIFFFSTVIRFIESHCIYFFGFQLVISLY